MRLSRVIIGWYGERHSQSASDGPMAGINSSFPFFLGSSVSAHFLGSVPEWLWRHLPDLHIPHGETHNDSLAIVWPLDGGKSSSHSSCTSLIIKICWLGKDPVKGFSNMSKLLIYTMSYVCAPLRWSMWLDSVWEGSLRCWIQTANCLWWGSCVSVDAFHFTLCSVFVSKTSSKMTASMCHNFSLCGLPVTKDTMQPVL